MSEEQELCGAFAAPLVPRLNLYYACSLPKGHSGDEHRAGGTCPEHGPYVMDESGITPQCPHWPNCKTLEELQQQSA